MKNITIVKPNRKQFTKEICLGNGCKKQFNSKRAAGYFVADTNRFLTKALVIINDILANTYFEYRQLWFVTTNGHHGTRVNQIGQEQAIKGLLQSAEFMMDKFSFSSSGSNDPFFAFVDLQKAAFYLLDCNLKMMDFHKKRNATSAFYKTQMLHDRCLSVVDKLKNYGY